VDPALALSVAQRLQAGETLSTGSYRRTHLFSLEASTLVGPGQLDVDVSFTPRQTYFNADFSALDKSAVTWVAGYSQASDSPLVYSVSYLGTAVFDVGAQQQLLLLEPATTVGAARTAFFHLFLGSVSYGFFERRLEVSLRGAFEPIQRSFAMAPKVSWEVSAGLRVYAAAELYVGQPWTPFGYFGRNGQVLLGVRSDFW
jgi:hypothetical protein